MNLSNSNREQPRERLREKGVAYLSDAELVAVLLGTGAKGCGSLALAQEMLNQLGGVAGLVNEGLGSLCSKRGMGDAKAARLLAAVELGVRVVERRCIQKQAKGFTCSKEIFERYHARLSQLSQEVFLVVGLNNKNEIISEAVVAMGSVDECRVNPREVFRPLITEAAARTLVLHNHPSGDPRPSAEDIALTRRISEAGMLLGIPLLDHLVIGHHAYCSLRDMGVFMGRRGKDGENVVLVDEGIHQ